MAKNGPYNHHAVVLALFASSPGQAYSLPDVADLLALSRISLRETLRLLARRGLLQQVGTRINGPARLKLYSFTALSAKDLRQRFHGKDPYQNQVRRA